MGSEIAKRMFEVVLIDCRRLRPTELRSAGDSPLVRSEPSTDTVVRVCFPIGFEDELMPGKWTMRRRARWIGVLLASLVSLTPSGPGLARGQAASTPGPDQEARVLLRRVADAYKALDSYSDDGQFVVAMTLGEKPRREARPVRLTFNRPNKIDLDVGSVRLISDGKTLTTVVRPLKKYTTAKAPAKIGIDTFREGPAGPLLFGGPTGAPTFILLNLIVGTNPDTLLEALGGTCRVEAGAIRIDHREGPDLLIRIDPTTRLISAIEMKIAPSRTGGGTTPSIKQFGWTAGVIATQPPDERSFAFVVPVGFASTKDLTARAGDTGAGARYAVEETIGKPAPDFRLTLLDGPGKVREVTKHELAGKVVVIDFWATWCGPCIVELPEIKKLVAYYNPRKQDVLIVALSQDMLPEELPALRALVEKTLADKAIDLTAGPVWRVGLDPSNSVGRAFNIEGFPSVVILDRQGIVRSAYVGYHSDTDLPLHQALAKEIDAILAGH
jgi:thiol-disulfide isomerase/thioredoxin